MLNLLKYEIKKGYRLKIVVAIITLLAEAIYLYGLLIKNSEEALALGIVALMMCAIFGTILIGISGIQTLHKELNSKQSYMLFMIPKSNYEIIGAKLIEGVLSFICTGALYAILAMVDLYLLEGVADESLIAYIFSAYGITSLSATDILVAISSFMSECLLLYMSAYLAVIACATVLNGIRFGGWISLIVYIVINNFTYWLSTVLFRGFSISTTLYLQIVYSLILTIVFYFISGWIMSRKLSV